MPPKFAALSLSIKRPQRVGVLSVKSFNNIDDGNQPRKRDGLILAVNNFGVKSEGICN